MVGGSMRFESVILLIGRPGSGKNVVGGMLEEQYGYKQVICSEALGNDPEIALIKAQGRLVNDDIVIHKMTEYLREHPELGSKLVLNGATRTQPQAVGIVDMLQHEFDTGARIATFEIFAYQEQSWHRQLTRPDIRDDKNPASIRQRDSLYDKNERGVRDYLNTITRLYTIDNSGVLTTTEANLRLEMRKELAILQDRCPKSRPNFATHVEAIHYL